MQITEKITATRTHVAAATQPLTKQVVLLNTERHQLVITTINAAASNWYRSTTGTYYPRPHYKSLTPGTWLFELKVQLRYLFTGRMF